MEQTERFRVAWVDTDASGRIHYTAALKWAEATEAALFRRVGILGEYGRYPRRHIEAEYRRMLEFDDEVEVRLVVARLGKTSVRFDWTICHEGNEAVTGTHTVVFVSEDGHAEPLIDDVRAALTPL